jgi:hypothetical protein
MKSTDNQFMSCGVTKVSTQSDNHQRIRTTVTLSFQQGKKWPTDAPQTFFNDIVVEYEGHPRHAVGQKVEGAYDSLRDLLKL